MSLGLRSSFVEMNSISKLKGREIASRPVKLVTTTSSGPSGPLVMRIRRFVWFKAIASTLHTARPPRGSEAQQAAEHGRPDGEWMMVDANSHELCHEPLAT